MNLSSVNRSPSDYHGRHVFLNVLFLVGVVAFSTHILPDQSRGLRILHRSTAYADPAVSGSHEVSCTGFDHATVANCLLNGEAQFTPEHCNGITSSITVRMCGT